MCIVRDHLVGRFSTWLVGVLHDMCQCVSVCIGRDHHWPFRTWQQTAPRTRALTEIKRVMQAKNPKIPTTDELLEGLCIEETVEGGGLLAVLHAPCSFTAHGGSVPRSSCMCPWMSASCSSVVCCFPRVSGSASSLSSLPRLTGEVLALCDAKGTDKPADEAPCSVQARHESEDLLRVEPFAEQGCERDENDADTLGMDSETSSEEGIEDDDKHVAVFQLYGGESGFIAEADRGRWSEIVACQPCLSLVP